MGSNYPTNFSENFDTGYVDYDDPTSYEYAAGNIPPGAYDQAGFYQGGGQVNAAQYGSGGAGNEYYDQHLYSGYNEQFNPAIAPVAPASSSKSE